MSLPPLSIRHFTCPTPIVQGGMGVGVSLARLAGAVAREGGLGTVSSACLDRLVGKRLGHRVTCREAAEAEVIEAKRSGGVVAMNVMVALDSTYDDSVLGAMDGGVDAIVSGAGMPLRLPSVMKSHPRTDDVALVPIVSCARALRLLCRRWEKAGRRPDAAVLEGPLAGGHLGWKTVAEVRDPANRLENLLPDVLSVAREHGGFPVIAAGGVFTHDDICRILGLGAAGVQMGTRFLATVESGASPAYKRAVVDCNETGILVAQEPGSPCKLPFRVLAASPMYRQALSGGRPARCNKGYLLYAGKCSAWESPERFFCICNGLLSSAGYDPEEGQPPLYTVGANAHRIDRILPVSELMAELRCGSADTRTRAEPLAVAAA